MSIRYFGKCWISVIQAYPPDNTSIDSPLVPPIILLNSTKTLCKNWSSINKTIQRLLDKHQRGTPGKPPKQTSTSADAYKSGILMPPSRHPMKKHIAAAGCRCSYRMRVLKTTTPRTRERRLKSREASSLGLPAPHRLPAFDPIFVFFLVLLSTDTKRKTKADFTREMFEVRENSRQMHLARWKSERRRRCLPRGATGVGRLIRFRYGAAIGALARVIVRERFAVLVALESASDR